MPEFGIGLFILAFAIFGAGTIRGFAGFGDALFFLPLGSQVLSPVEAIMVFVFVAALGPMPLMPQAWRDAPRNLATPLVVFVALTLPFGFMLLTKIDPVIFKYVLSTFAIGIVIIMILRLSPHFEITSKSAGVLGAVSGFVGGFTGVPGTILMFVLLNSQLRSKDVRALSLLTLLSFDAVLLLMGILFGRLSLSLLVLALLMVPFYFIGSLLGRKIFDPEKEGTYRNIALVLIFMSGVLGLPIFAGH